MPDLISTAENAIPGVAQAKAAFSLAEAAWPLLAAVGGVGAVAGFWLYIHELQAGKARAEAQAAAQHGQAVVAQGQATASADAAKIIDAGRTRADVTIHVQQEHADAILSAPGAAQGVDPGLYAVFVGGVCAYASTASDPRCPTVRSTDPAQLPPAGQERGAAGADSR